MEDKDFIIENGVLIAYNGANETVIVPDGITAIGEIAFEWNENLKQVILPQSLQEIGFFAFRGCKFIFSPNGLEKRHINFIDEITTNSFLNTFYQSAFLSIYGDACKVHRTANSQ